MTSKDFPAYVIINGVAVNIKISINVPNVSLDDIKNVYPLIFGPPIKINEPIPDIDNVYVMRNSYGNYKIGFSGRLQKRLAEAQTFNDLEVKLLACGPGGEAMEKYYHKKYESKRTRPKGEWFKLNESEITDLLAEILLLRSSNRDEILPFMDPVLRSVDFSYKSRPLTKKNKTVVPISESSSDEELNLSELQLSSSLFKEKQSLITESKDISVNIEEFKNLSINTPTNENEDTCSSIPPKEHEDTCLSIPSEEFKDTSLTESSLLNDVLELCNRENNSHIVKNSPRRKYDDDSFAKYIQDMEQCVINPPTEDILNNPDVSLFKGILCSNSVNQYRSNDIYFIDNRTIIGSSSIALWMLDLYTGKQKIIKEINASDPLRIIHIAVLFDNRIIIFYNNKSFQIWNSYIPDITLNLFYINIKSNLYNIYMMKGKIVTITDDGYIECWALDGKLITYYLKQEQKITCVTCSQDTLVIGRSDGTIELLDPTTDTSYSANIILKEHVSPITHLEIMSNRFFSISTDKIIRFWKRNTYKKKLIIDNTIEKFFIDKGKIIVLKNLKIVIFNSKGILENILIGLTNTIIDIKFIPNSNRVIGISMDGKIHMWILQTDRSAIKVNINTTIKKNCLDARISTSFDKVIISHGNQFTVLE